MFNQLKPEVMFFSQKSLWRQGEPGRRPQNLRIQVTTGRSGIEPLWILGHAGQQCNSAFTDLAVVFAKGI